MWKATQRKIGIAKHGKSDAVHSVAEGLLLNSDMVNRVIFNGEGFEDVIIVEREKVAVSSPSLLQPQEVSVVTGVRRNTRRSLCRNFSPTKRTRPRWEAL